MRKKSLSIFLFLIAVFIIILSLGIGKYQISADKVFSILLSPFFSFENYTDLEHQIIWDIRMPRVLLAMFAGGLLSLCGASLQGIFYNPLVDPHIIGVTSGSAFGGALAILLGLSPFFLIISSFVFGMISLVLVYFLANILKERNNLILVLSGVIMSGFFSALVSLIQYIADSEEKLPSIIFWLMGSFSTAGWQKLVIFIVPSFIAGFIILKLRWRINILSLGDEAKLLDKHSQSVKWTILIMCAIIVSSQVAVSGSIGWIGLIIPHLARMLIGADHRKLLPVSILLGGSFMVLVDNIARLGSDSEIPIGIITALFGAPIFTLLAAKTIGKRTT